MSDGSLRCCANNCIHNEFYECRAGAIVVGGHKATSTKGTFCESFVDKGESILTDFVDGGYTSTDNIKCEACNCKYNQRKNCVADVMEINKDDASCDTFIQ